MPAKNFIKYLQHQKNYSGQTLKAYESDLAQFFVYLQNLYEWQGNTNSIDKQQVRSWIASLVSEGKSSSSVKRKLSSLKSFFKYQQQQGERANNPANDVATPKKPKRLPKTIDTKAINKLLEKHYFGDGFAGQRDKIVVELIYETGMRLNELMNLRVLDIYFEENTLKVTGKGNKERLIPFSNTLKNNLIYYLEVRNKQEFEDAELQFLIITNKGKKTYDKLISRITKKYLSLVITNEHRNPHVLRHTFASALLNNGADLNAIKELLGHESLAATQVYTHNSVEQLKKVYFLTHPKS